MFVTSGKAQIAYDVVGAPAGPASHDVLLMHAGVNDRRSWSHVVERLSPRHRCVELRPARLRRDDVRAGGRLVRDATRRRSWMPPASSSVVIVACSMGGAAALDFALDYPDGSRDWC